MATQTSALIVLAQNYAGDIKRQVNRRSVLLSTLDVRPGEGKNVAWVAQGDGAYAEFFSETAALGGTGSDVQASAILNWANLRANFSVSGLAMATSATSRTPTGLIDLWSRNMVDAAGKLGSTANAALYTGNGTLPNLAGLDVAIGSITNTYATIDRTVGANSFWLPYVVNPGVATALTFDQIRLDLGAIYNASGFRPDFAMVSTAVMRKLAGLYDPLKQYTFSVSPLQYNKNIRTQRGEFVMEGGVGQLVVDGCIFIEDKDCPSGAIYYLNSEYVHIEYLPFDMSVLGASDEQMEMLANDGIEQLPLGVRMEMLAKTNDVENATMKTYFQLVVDRPNACGVRLNVSVA